MPQAPNPPARIMSLSLRPGYVPRTDPNSRNPPPTQSMEASNQSDAIQPSVVAGTVRGIVHTECPSRISSTQRKSDSTKGDGGEQLEARRRSRGSGARAI